MAGIMQPRTHFLAQACRVVARVEYGVTAKAGVTIICLIVSQNRINTLIIIPCDFVAISFPYEASMALLETFPTQPNRHFFGPKLFNTRKCPGLTADQDHIRFPQFVSYTSFLSYLRGDVTFFPLNFQ